MDVQGFVVFLWFPVFPPLPRPFLLCVPNCVLSLFLAVLGECVLFSNWANHCLKNLIVLIFQKAFRTINVIFIGTWKYLYNCTENNLSEMFKV